MTIFHKGIKAYKFFIVLVLSIICGGIVGYFMGPQATYLKPLGDIFLNLIFTVVVPLIFFSVASAIARMHELARFGKIIFYMFGAFIFMAAIASIYMIIVVQAFPPAQELTLNITTSPIINHANIGEQIVNIFTVPDFIKLFSREHMLALIIFSMLVGLSTLLGGKNSKPFANFLFAGEAVFMKIVMLIMYYAPVGFFAYFAVLTGELGSKLFETYFRVITIYYLSALTYFFIAFSAFAYIAAKIKGIKLFWSNAFLPMVTAFATGSSAACIPVNLQAAKKIGVPADIYETIIPIGTVLHKNGSVIGGVLKIAFLFGIFHMSFSSPSVLIVALVTAILVGTVMGAIPGGGMVGEMLILSMYGFPQQTLVMIAAISMLIDPLATVLNVLGNNVCSMLVARLVEGREWLNASMEKH